MVVIGELLNGMYKAVGAAIERRDKAPVQALARDQVRAGANVLDVNTGPYAKNPLDSMKWLVETIQEAVDVPLAIDSTKADVVEAGLALAKQRAIINSTSADREKMETIFALAGKYGSQVIGLTMDKSGVPGDRMKRVELAAAIITVASEHGIAADDLFIDPIVLPVNVAQSQGGEVLAALKEFALLSDPAPRTVVGLSNVSQGSAQRSLINRTFFVMAIASGLSGAILDPLDKELMDAMIAAELLLNRNIYCDSFLDAYRKK